MAKYKFKEFMTELRAEAKADGPEAVAELESFGEYFRLAREVASARRSLGLTQRDLATRTGINQSEISDIERGQANPTYRTLQVLAKGVGRRWALVKPRPVAARRKRRQSGRSLRSARA